MKEVDTPLAGAIVPLRPPLVNGAIMPAGSSLGDTIVPAEPPLVNDEMVLAGELSRSRERGLAGYLKENSIWGHLGGSSYRCQAKLNQRVPHGLKAFATLASPKQLGPLCIALDRIGLSRFAPPLHIARSCSKVP